MPSLFRCSGVPGHNRPLRQLKPGMGKFFSMRATLFCQYPAKGPLLQFIFLVENTIYFNDNLLPQITIHSIITCLRTCDKSEMFVQQNNY